MTPLPVSQRRSAGSPRIQPDAVVRGGIGEQIATLAARLHAATPRARWCLLSFVRRTRAGWNAGVPCPAPTGCIGGPASTWGPRARKCASPRRWRHCRSSAARLQRGEISYAKVRALSRIATPGNEASTARPRLCGHRRARRARRARMAPVRSRVEESQEHGNAGTYSRELLRPMWMTTGRWCLRGPADAGSSGAIVQRALDAAQWSACSRVEGTPQPPDSVVGGGHTLPSVVLTHLACSPSATLPRRPGPRRHSRPVPGSRCTSKRRPPKSDRHDFTTPSRHLELGDGERPRFL